jgi:glycosyltransferase involved in cell wall biosynthesis
MKIIQITHSFFPHSVGGREKQVYDLAKALVKKGHEVEIFTCSDSFWKSYTKKENSKLKIHYFKTIKIKFSAGYYRIPLGMFFSLMTKKFDLLHAHEYFHFTTFLSSLVSKLRKIPLIFTEHGYPEQVGTLKIALKTYDKFVLPFIISNCERIIVVSNFIKKELISKCRVSEDKVKVIYNGINLREYEKENKTFSEKYNLKEKKIVLAMGRLIKEKGFQYLIKAIPLVKKEIPEISNVIFVILGPEVYYGKKLKKLAKNLGVEKEVFFLGPLSEKMVKSAISSSNLIAIPSIYEPFGIVALEAMAFEKPIIASNTGGLKEFLNEKNSILIKPGDENELANGIIKILKDKELADKIGKKAREDVKKFELRKIVNKVLEIYKKAIEK